MAGLGGMSGLHWSEVTLGQAGEDTMTNQTDVS